MGNDCWGPSPEDVREGLKILAKIEREMERQIPIAAAHIEKLFRELNRNSLNLQVVLKKLIGQYREKAIRHAVWLLIDRGVIRVESGQTLVRIKKIKGR